MMGINSKAACKQKGLSSSTKTATCSGVMLNVPVWASKSTYPDAACEQSHSCIIRSTVPVFLASSLAVTGSVDSAMASYNPSRTPTVVSGGLIGTGFTLDTILSLGVQSDGTILVGNFFLSSPLLGSIDPATGDRTAISGGGAGSGPLLTDTFPLHFTLAVAPTTDASGWHLYR